MPDMSRGTLALVTALLVGCAGPARDELPPPADISLAQALTRGATAPDPDGLREAVVRDYLAKLPTHDNPVFPAPRELCLSVEPQEESARWGSPVPPPPPFPCPFHDPTPAFLHRFSRAAVRVVPATECSLPVAGLETGQITRWSRVDPEFGIAADVVLGAVGYVRFYTAEHTPSGWILTGCTTAIGPCDDPRTEGCCSPTTRCT
jgi:hypothetical protein